MAGDNDDDHSRYTTLQTVAEPNARTVKPARAPLYTGTRVLTLFSNGTNHGKNYAKPSVRLGV